MLGSFVLRNTGSTPCLGTDPESVGLQDASGKSLAVKEVKEVSDPPSHPILLPGLPVPSGDGGLGVGYGSVAFIWSEWCGPEPARPVSLAVHLGPGVTRVVPVVQSGSIPRCDTPGSPSTLEVYPLDILPGDPWLLSPAP